MNWPVRIIFLVSVLMVQPVIAQLEPPLPISYVPAAPVGYQPFGIFVGTSICDVIFADAPLSVVQQGNALRITLSAQLSGVGICNQPVRTLTFAAPPLPPGAYIFELYYVNPIGAPLPVLRDSEPLVVSGDASQSVPANSRWAMVALLFAIGGLVAWRFRRA